MSRKVVLGFSGGLDTSYCAIYLRDKGYEPICVSVDIGQGVDEKALREAASRLGINDLRVIDGRSDFATYFIAPAIQANAMYQGVYPLATALSRPLIAKVMVDIAREVGTNLFAHGCTGKGNDQIRIEMAIKALCPASEVIAPIREENLNREEEMGFLADRGINLGITKDKPYSIDQNLWGRSVCAGVLEDPSVEVPEDIYEWTRSVLTAPERAETLSIDFEHGVPVRLNDAPMNVLSIVEDVNEIAGKHGIGRIDHIEDRLVGIKSREIYEAPAATVIIKAHRALEAMTLTSHTLKFKRHVENEYGDLVYLGNWFSPHHLDLLAYLQHNQKLVNGTVSLQLHRGNISYASRKSTNSLYRPRLATYGKMSTFDQRSAKGFVDTCIREVSITADSQVLNYDRESRDLLEVSRPCEKGVTKLLKGV